MNHTTYLIWRSTGKKKKKILTNEALHLTPQTNTEMLWTIKATFHNLKIFPPSGYSPFVPPDPHSSTLNPDLCSRSTLLRLLLACAFWGPFRSSNRTGSKKLNEGKRHRWQYLSPLVPALLGCFGSDCNLSPKATAPARDNDVLLLLTLGFLWIFLTPAYIFVNNHFISSISLSSEPCLSCQNLTNPSSQVIDHDLVTILNRQDRDPSLPEL